MLSVSGIFFLTETQSEYFLFSLTNSTAFFSGAPGTGKSHVCGIALAHALCNGLVAFVTSLAARRAVQVGGEHIHRLFAIPVTNLPAKELAEKACLDLVTI